MGSGPIRVLICDDDERFRDGLRLLLDRDDRIEVVAEAASGEEALKLALLHRPEIVTMDIEMPVIDGVEATKQLRELLPEIKVVLVSSSDYAGRADTARDAGAAAYVTKPRVFELLVEVVVAVAHGDNCVSAIA